MLITNYAINNFRGAERVWSENSTGDGLGAAESMCDEWREGGEAVCDL